MITVAEGRIRQARIRQWMNRILLASVVAVCVALLVQLPFLQDHSPDFVRGSTFAVRTIFLSGGIAMATGFVGVVLLCRNVRRVDPTTPGDPACGHDIIDSIESVAMITASEARIRQARIAKWMIRIVLACAVAAFAALLMQIPSLQDHLPHSIRGRTFPPRMIYVSVGISMAAGFVCCVLLLRTARRVDPTTTGDPACGHDINDSTEPTAGSSAAITVSQGTINMRAIVKWSNRISIPCYCVFFLAMFLGLPSLQPHLPAGLRTFSGRIWAMLVPAGMGMITVLVSTALLHRSNRRIDVTKPGCPACGYDITDNASGTCPECGTAITEKRQTD